jgi:hypothetical protein
VGKYTPGGNSETFVTKLEKLPLCLSTACSGVEVKIHLFYNLVLDGGERSASCCIQAYLGE